MIGQIHHDMASYCRQKVISLCLIKISREHAFVITYDNGFCDQLGCRSGLKHIRHTYECGKEG